MLVGPSNSGKSYFGKNLLSKWLTAMEIKYKYLSSDDLRRDILCDETLKKHDSKMMTASVGAFSIMHNNLDVYTSYPINTPIVVCDATNLSRHVRNIIHNIADKNGYLVTAIVFDYKEMDDYMRYLDPGTDRGVIRKHVMDMRKKTMKELDRSKFKDIYKIDSIDFNDLNTFFSYSKSEKAINETEENVCFVGDLHGCYDEFVECLLDNKGIAFTDELDGVPAIVKVEGQTYIHHILIGDLIDKGNSEGVRKIVELIYKNPEFFSIVEGNHDRWNYNYLTGKISKNADSENLINNWFDSVRLFENDSDLRTKFLDIYSKMATFVYNDKFIATHAPCENKYLGKNDKVSSKKMNTIMYPKRADFETEDAYMEDREKFFSFLERDADNSFPLHIFGHVMLKNVFQLRNKYGIDTGCVVGNTLSTLILMKENKKPYVRRYKSRQTIKQELIPLFRTKRNDVDFNALEHDVQRRIKWMAKNRVNFVSGTMSPCDKDMENGVLESIWKGIEYYRSKGVKELIIQPKFMGSRANLLLHRNDLSLCKMISRNAYSIEQSRLNTEGSLEQIFTGLQKQFEHLFVSGNFEYILFDGELLPWNSMGKELIEREFMVAYKAVTSEYSELKKFGFEDALALHAEKYNGNTVFEKPHEISAKKSWDAFKQEMIPLDTINDAAEKYKKQLDIFNITSELEYKPFAILKTINFDGTEENGISSNNDNGLMFTMLSNEPFLKIDLSGDISIIGNMTHPTAKSVKEGVEYFWNYITQQKEMEGVVIKPAKAYVPGVAPYLKCRNTEYLRLTYGFDYDVIPHKSDLLIHKKNISRKMETSIKEYELGRRMLDVKLTDISIENSEWVGLALSLISEQEKEKELDPRL